MIYSLDVYSLLTKYPISILPSYQQQKKIQNGLNSVFFLIYIHTDWL